MKNNLQKSIYFFILLLIVALTIVYIANKNSDSEEERLLSQISTSNVPIKDLLLSENMVSPGFTISHPNFVRSRRDHGDEIEVVIFDPSDGSEGILYQEVTKFPNAYQAWLLVYGTSNFPDWGWVAQEQYQIPTSNNADQWLLGCDDSEENLRVYCALVARYKDIVITIESSFNPEGYSSEEFVNLAKLIDEKAYKLIMD